MKKIGPALLLVLGIVVPSADADYVLIRYKAGVAPPNPMGGQPGTAVVKPGDPVYAAALVEARGNVQFKGGGIPFITTKWGTTFLYQDKTSLFVVGEAGKAPADQLVGFRWPSVTGGYVQKKKELDKDPTAAKYLEAAEWTLQRALNVSYLEKDSFLNGDMLKLFKDLMDKVAENSNGAPANVQTALTTYQKVREEVAKALPPDQNLIDRWTAKLSCKAQNERAHYTLLYKDQVHPEMANRIKALERVFEGYYYWFALKGQALPMPKKRLVVLILEDPSEFRQKHAGFGTPPLQVDGFFARREQVAVFANEPLTEGYHLLSKFTEAELWRKEWKWDALLRGERLAKAGWTPDQIYHAQTLALLQKTMQEEGELIANTWLGTEQLVVASLLPRTVTPPEWFQVGMPALFAASPGALWAGFGGPNWEKLYDFQDIKPTESAPVQLRRLLTGDLFRSAAAANDPEARRHAEALSWALAYYLAQKETAGLVRYCQELSALPRELELDDRVVLDCFARAFDLADPTKPDGLDEGKFLTFAVNTLNFGLRTPLPISMNDLRRVRTEMSPPAPRP